MQPRFAVRLAGALALGLLLSLAIVPVRGLVFYATGDADHNATPPPSDLVEAGWQWQGNWRGFGGTPIAPNLFLTAKHVGGSVGEEFLFASRRYPTLAAYPDAGSDLIVWKVCGEFPTFAPLYEGNGETGKRATLFGHGLGRGAEVNVTNGPIPGLRGWQWGPGDGRLRWGENVIARIAQGPHSAGDQLLMGLFDATGGPNEAMLTGGDSGSGLFVLSGAGWRLAGVNFSVDGPFRRSDEEPGFQAALFDKRGLYEPGSDGTWQLVPEDEAPVPGAFYATRVSARLTWLRGIIAAESQREASPVVEIAGSAAGPFAVVAPVSANAGAHWLVVPRQEANQFVRLQHCRAVRIVRATLTGAGLELRWE